MFVSWVGFSGEFDRFVNFDIGRFVRGHRLGGRKQVKGRVGFGVSRG